MENKRRFRPDPDLKLMDQVRQVLRYHHYAYRTENTYCDWIVRYVKYFGAKKHPRDMGKTEIHAYLSHLATERKVSASTQRQALNAIMLLYRQVLRKKRDGAKKINKSLCKFDSPFVCYALSPSYCVHFPRLTYSKPCRSLAAQ